MCVVWCQGGGDANSELASRFEAPNESNRWDRPLIIARRLNGKMDLDWDRLEQCIADKREFGFFVLVVRFADGFFGTAVAPPNQGTVPEPRSLMQDTDAAIASVIQNVLQGKGDPALYSFSSDWFLQRKRRAGNFCFHGTPPWRSFARGSGNIWRCWMLRRQMFPRRSFSFASSSAKSRCVMIVVIAMPPHPSVNAQIAFDRRIARTKKSEP